jgi:hypothetical protein
MSNVKVLGPPNTGYTDLLNHLTEEHLKEQRATGKDRSKTPLRPSAAGQCTRELAYALMEHHGFANYEKKINSAEGHRIFSLGHAVEYDIIKHMRELMKGYFEIKYTQQSLSFARLEAKNNPKLSQWLEGSTDLVLWSEKHKCIADIKSKKVKYSSYRDDNWTEFSDKLRRLPSVHVLSDTAFWVEDLPQFLLEVNDPFLAANFLQLNLYAMNPFIVERGIDHASIIQYDKNSSRLREIRFKPSKELYDYIILKMQTALNAVDEEKPELAPRDFQLGSIKCAFCDFAKECWKDVDTTREFFKSLPPKRWAKDTSRLGELGTELDEVYAEYAALVNSEEPKQRLENELVDLLNKNEITKVRFADGNVYEVKLYKSPREHFALKRSK